MRIFFRVLKVIGIVLGVVVLVGGIFVYTQCSAFDASLAKVYDVPVPNITRSTDPAVIARGKHLAESVGGCAGDLCHGHDLGGGKPIVMGPLGTACGPNITPDNMGAAYSDGELARLIRHGIKKDGRSVRLMPAQDLTWLPDSDVVALVSYIRTVAPGDRPNGTTTVGALGKVLDRQDKIIFDVARRIDHAKKEAAPAPEPTAGYGAYLARLCTGCHGEHLSGGRIPGTPSSIPTPLNLTPDATGLAGWTYSDFDKLMKQGVRKNGKTLDPFMPVEEWKNFDDTEEHALWAYLQTLPPAPFGGR
ncbi:MAG TPA: c-type cytochrome [Polyangiaceae bacterium]